MKRLMFVFVCALGLGSCASLSPSTDGLLVKPSSIAEGIKMLGDLQRENAALKKELAACKGEGP